MFLAFFVAILYLHLSLFYFLFSLFRQSLCFQQAVFSPPFCGTYMYGAEGKRHLKSSCCVVCFHCDVLKQSLLLFTSILCFSWVFFLLPSVDFFISVQFPISNHSAVRLRVVLFSFSLLQGCWTSPRYYRTVLWQWLRKLSCMPCWGPHEGLCLFCRK